MGIIAGSLVITAVTADSWVRSNAPLFTYRMEKASSEMNFSPTSINEFIYSAEEGYSLNCGGTDSLCFDPKPLGPTLRTCEETCGDTCATCQETCVSTCSSTCVNTCYTCVSTCPNTCVSTCSTCVSTCPSTCVSTCSATCATCQTCGWITCFSNTCIDC